MKKVLYEVFRRYFVLLAFVLAFVIHFNFAVLEQEILGLKEYGFLISFFLVLSSAIKVVDNPNFKLKQIFQNKYTYLIILLNIFIALLLLILVNTFSFSQNIYFFVASLVLLFAAPTGATSLIYISRRRGDIILGFSIVVVSTMVSLFFLPFVFYFLNIGGIEFDTFVLRILTTLVVPIAISLFFKNKFVKTKKVILKFDIFLLFLLLFLSFLSISRTLSTNTSLLFLFFLAFALVLLLMLLPRRVKRLENKQRIAISHGLFHKNTALLVGVILDVDIRVLLFIVFYMVATHLLSSFLKTPD